MKEKMTCLKANKLDLVEYLSTLGHKPVKIQNNDFWYRSPLRQEKTASFKVNRMLNLWFDHGPGEGGTFVDFGIRYHRCSIPELLKLLSSYSPGIAFSFQRPSTTPAIAGEKKKPTHETIHILQSRPLENKSLLLYLHQRNIDPDFAKGFCREIDFCLYGRERTAIGFPNRSGGFELRSQDFKGSSSPKDISLLLNAPASKQINVLEGFTDFLSLLSMEPDFKTKNFLVLNSLSFAGKSLDVLKAYDGINLYLDHDTAGKKATAEIMKALPHAIDHSFFYRRYKDLNEYLAERKGGGEETTPLKKNSMGKEPDNGESTAEEQRQKRQQNPGMGL